eukprot:UN17835
MIYILTVSQQRQPLTNTTIFHSSCKGITNARPLLPKEYIKYPNDIANINKNSITVLKMFAAIFDENLTKSEKCQP